MSCIAATAFPTTVKSRKFGDFSEMQCILILHLQCIAIRSQVVDKCSLSFSSTILDPI